MSVALAHTYGDGPCSACGDLDGCHVPAKVRRTPAGAAGHGPLVVCLCGSTRFRDAYEAAARDETLAGNIVLSVGLLGHAEGIDMAGPVKAMLDELHLRKVETADEVLVLNVGQYIGQSTAREVAHAMALGKRVRYLEPGEKGGG